MAGLFFIIPAWAGIRRREDGALCKPTERATITKESFIIVRMFTPAIHRRAALALLAITAYDNLAGLYEAKGAKGKAAAARVRK